MKYLDYTFYRFCLWFKKNDNEPNYILSGYCIITLFEIFNLASIEIFLGFFIKYLLFKTTLGTIISIGSVFAFNFIRYNKVTTFEMIEEKYQNDSDKARFKKGVFVVMYMIATPIIVILLTMALDKQPWNK